MRKTERNRRLSLADCRDADGYTGLQEKQTNKQHNEPIENTKTKLPLFLSRRCGDGVVTFS